MTTGILYQKSKVYGVLGQTLSYTERESRIFLCERMGQ